MRPTTTGNGTSRQRSLKNLMWKASWRSQKEPARAAPSCVSPLSDGAKAVPLDVEGTTTPLAFVTKVLFPYVREHLRAHLEQLAASNDYATILERLGREHHASSQRGETPPAWVDGPTHARTASAVAFVEWLMDRNVKSTPLKELQDRIWEDGYRRGTLERPRTALAVPAFISGRPDALAPCVLRHEHRSKDRPG